MSKQSKACTNCEGTGSRVLNDLEPGVLGDCPNCEGTGILADGVVHDQDIVDKLDDIIDKLVDIKEVVDALS